MTRSYRFKNTPYPQRVRRRDQRRTTLEAGFTTVRDLGSRPFLAVDLRDSIDEGYLVGPRIVASGPGISMTGGHGDLNRLRPAGPRRDVPRRARLPDRRRRRPGPARRPAQIKHGVDVIKVHASGGVMSRGDPPGAPQFTVEEITGRRRGSARRRPQGRGARPRAQGIKNAVIAGVDSIEHGSLIDDEGIQMMLKQGTWLVADIYNDDYLLGKAIEFKLPQESIDKEQRDRPVAAR